MAITIRPNDIDMATTPTLSSTTLPTPPALKLEKKMTAPRIDLEPLHNAVKSAISDADWKTYKSTISTFLLGNINQEELSAVIDRILSTPALVHAHNQLIIGIYANAQRDPPEPGVVGWADDKLSGLGSSKGGMGSKSGVQGDGAEAEKRLKKEVMALPRRERKRLKQLKENDYDALYAEMMEMTEARRIHVPETISGGASAGGFQKTNWDLEIRKRYTTPLFVETHEFPDASTIASRMLPICYEEGLPQGHSAEAPAFMNIATENYIKEMLTTLFSRICSNGADYIQTAKYKREYAREERLVKRGELTRTAGGLLPCEAEEMRKRPPITMEDLRMCLVLGDSYLGQTPIIAGEIMNGRFLDAPGVEDLEAETVASPPTRKAGLPNGVGIAAHQPSALNGQHVDLDEPSAVPDDEWQWTGSTAQDVDAMDSVLDNCLAVGM